MKKIVRFLLIIISLSSLLSACGKADGLLYEDKTTATLATKSGWTATADSETADGLENTGKASAVIDGNINTYWHTDYSTVVPYPHWVLIDMKEAKHLIAVLITNRQAATPNRNGMKNFKLEASNDGSNFELLGEFEFAVSNAAQNFPVSSKNAYRYLKLTALSSQTSANHTFLAEIDVVTTKN